MSANYTHYSLETIDGLIESAKELYGPSYSELVKLKKYMQDSGITDCSIPVGNTVDQFILYIEEDRAFVDMASGSTKDELINAKKVLRAIAFKAGYGHDPELCLSANHVINHISKLEREVDGEQVNTQIERNYCLGCGKEIMTESGQVCNDCGR